MKKVLILLILLGIQFQNSAQSSLKNKNWWVIPSTLVGLGIVASSDQFKQNQVSFHDNNLQNFHTNADDFLQYTPILINVGLSLASSDKKNRQDKLARFAIGTVLYVGITQGLKRTLEIKRPDGGEHSFPSGHTTTAFFGAHLLAKEVKDSQPWLAVVGYGLATTTGALRVANNAHWVSDVLVGAGIGIASAELGTMIWDKYKSKFHNKHAFQLNPIVGNQLYAVQLTWDLN